MYVYNYKIKNNVLIKYSQTFLSSEMSYYFIFYKTVGSILNSF